MTGLAVAKNPFDLFRTLQEKFRGLGLDLSIQHNCRSRRWLAKIGYHGVYFWLAEETTPDEAIGKACGRTDETQSKLEGQALEDAGEGDSFAAPTQWRLAGGNTEQTQKNFCIELGPCLVIGSKGHTAYARVVFYEVEYIERSLPVPRGVWL